MKISNTYFSGIKNYNSSFRRYKSTQQNGQKCSDLNSAVKNNSLSIYNKKFNTLIPYKQIYNISFGQEPWKLNYYKSYFMSGDDAIKLFENFKLGNYLDLDGDPDNYKNKSIREKNLAFLDSVVSPNDQQKFIKYYEELTGFPNLEKVSQKIKNEFIRACSYASSYLKYNNSSYDDSVYDIIAAGYDGISSVGAKTAFPGSDLDKAFIILKGDKYSDEKNKQIVNNFKWRLWENTDQRILSYNHDVVSFPAVYTLKQIQDITNAINKKAEPMELFKKGIRQKEGFINQLLGRTEETNSPYDNYEIFLQKYNTDYVQANRFFIKLLNKFYSSKKWDNEPNYKNPSREDVYNAGFILETIDKGEILIGKRENIPIDRKIIHLINLSQIQALKNNYVSKPKYEERKVLCQIFNKIDIWSQFSIIKEMIKASCGDNSKYEEYFLSNETDKFNKVMEAAGLNS